MSLKFLENLKWPERADLPAVCGVTVAVFAVAWLLCRAAIEPRSTDVVMRYAFMAEAVAEGDWQFAFHPRFCVLFPMLAGGCAKLFSLPGDRACQLVSVAFWCAGAIPLWVLTRRLFGRFAAFAVLPLYFANVDLFMLAMDGWRDDCRILPLFLMALGFVRTLSAAAADDGGTRLGPVWMALGVFISVTLRADCFFISSLALFVYAVLVARRRLWRCLALPAAGWIVAVALDSWMVWSYTGWWLPIPHLIKFAEALT